MKLRSTSYTFDASAKTITSADFTSLEAILLITNATDNVIIYNFADADKGGSLSSTTLTLDYDTTGMDDADKLQIFYDDGQANPVLTAGESLEKDRMLVLPKFTPLKCTSDTLVQTGPGVLHTVVFTCNDAAPTAGSVIIYDNSAESGTELLNHTFTTTPFAPTSVTLDAAFAIGLYVGFTTTNDVNVLVTVI